MTESIFSWDNKSISNFVVLAADTIRTRYEADVVCDGNDVVVQISMTYLELEALNDCKLGESEKIRTNLWQLC